MAEPIAYRKMNGLGNDFVVVDARVGGWRFSADQVRRIADRETGIGCDQFIVMEKAPFEAADVFMRIYNAEGGEVDACGNATRCVAALVAGELGSDRVTVATNAGLLAGQVAGDMVTIDFGVPVRSEERRVGKEC